jgi:diguanylate cyclase (GGDEF)-like protein
MDNVDRQETMTRLCIQDGIEVQTVSTVDALLKRASIPGSDLLILDTEFCGVSGLELCGDLRSSPGFQHVPVLLLSEDDPSPEAVAMGLLSGADDYCSLLTARRPELRARIRVQLRNKLYRDAIGRLRDERNHLRVRATKDSLTGALGRSALEQAVQTELDKQGTFAVLFVDIDHFKSVNDTYGHQVGDLVLKAVVKTLLQGHRAGDACGRYGGEEFVMVLPKVNSEVASRVAERHRIAVNSLGFLNVNGPPSVSISLGIAVFDPGNPDGGVSAILRRADAALYAAKGAGRNCMRLAGPAVPSRRPSWSGSLAPSDAEERVT